MVNLRKAAKGQMCQIRIPGYCNKTTRYAGGDSL